MEAPPQMKIEVVNHNLWNIIRPWGCWFLIKKEIVPQIQAKNDHIIWYEMKYILLYTFRYNIFGICVWWLFISMIGLVNWIKQLNLCLLWVPKIGDINNNFATFPIIYDYDITWFDWGLLMLRTIDYEAKHC